ncbi:MAG TPA: SagB/ThcOx family dehydrogenase [Acidimicrobiales bacterium]|nr:SagB/ThcOx family dehydrogenase [Acidimicrobiales bacterium]
MTDELTPWRDFWLASELSPATGPAFGERINDAVPPSDYPGRFTYAAADHALPRPTDALAEAQAARASTRDFAPGPLPADALGAVFSAFADGAARRRAWPSAGGLYPLEVFALLLAVDHPLDGRAVHYEPDTHGLTDVGPAPSWAEVQEPLGGMALTGAPQVVVLFVLDPGAMQAKYGNRGGRFALVEVGHAAQNLALRLGASGLAGCELGGTYDRTVKRLLGLDDPAVLVALGYACGLHPEVAYRTRRKTARFLRNFRRGGR